jgi:hypothetical protein
MPLLEPRPGWRGWGVTLVALSAVPVLLAGCGSDLATESATSPASSAQPTSAPASVSAALNPSSITMTTTATTTSVTPGRCAFAIHVGTGASTTQGDNPHILRNSDGLFVSCAGAAPVQLRVDREQPALVLTFDGINTRLVQGNSAVAGPYGVTLTEQSGSGGRQVNFELALSGG